jgi:NTE family protein
MNAPAKELSDQKRVHIVLGSGENRCLAYVGALRALSECGHRFASISACSAGTLVAALVCAGLPLSRIEELLLETNLRQFQPKRRSFLERYLHAGWPFARYEELNTTDFLCDVLGSNPRLEKLPIPFTTIGVDLVSNSFVIYSSQTEPEMHLSEAVSIATAIPFAFPPYQKGGRIVVDAAVATDCPIWLSAMQEKELPIYAFSCFSERSAEPPQNHEQYFARILAAGAAAGDDAMFSEMSRLHRIEIPCPRTDADLFDISPETGRALIDAGARAVKGTDVYFFAEPSDMAQTSPTEGMEESRSLTKSVINNYYREVIMNTVTVTGDAIINIDSMLDNVQQNLEKSQGLAPEKKDELMQLVSGFRQELEKIKESHAEETAFITQRLEQLVQNAAQPPEKRKSSLLNLSGKGLVEAAEAVAGIAPKVLATARLILTFVAGL